MDTVIISFTPAMLMIIPIVAFLLQSVKSIPIIEALKWTFPLVAMLLGVGMTFLVHSPDMPHTAVVLAGFMVGANAIGGYDVTTMKKPTEVIPSPEVK